MAGRNSPPRHHNRRRAQLRSSIRLSTHRSRWRRRQHQRFCLSKRAIKMDPKAPSFFNQIQPCAAPQSSSSSSKSFPLSASTFVSSVLIPQPLLLIRAATKPQRGSPNRRECHRLGSGDEGHFGDGRNFTAAENARMARAKALAQARQQPR